MYVNIHMCTNVYHVRNLVTSNRGGVKSRALSYSSFTLLIKPICTASRYAPPLIQVQILVPVFLSLKAGRRSVFLLWSGMSLFPLEQLVNSLKQELNTLSLLYQTSN